MNLLHYAEVKSTHLLKSSKKVKLVEHHQILYIEADDNYSKVYFDDQTQILFSKTLRTFEKTMDIRLFFRCHKSYVINILHIREIVRQGELFALLHTGQRIPIARRRLGCLIKMLSEKTKITVPSKNTTVP
jgi:two-component system LytT family response regulator